MKEILLGSILSTPDLSKLICGLAEDAYGNLTERLRKILKNDTDLFFFVNL